MSTVVVTALYNGAPWIRETLDAVHNQTHKPQEHWVIDDGSTDNSVALVEAHGLSKLVRNPHRGPNAARNHAIRETRSKYIAILDQDDVWHPEHLALLEDALEKNPDAPAAFSRMQPFSTGEPTAYRIENGDPQRFDPWERFPINTIDTPAQVLMRREVLIAAGGWPTHIVGAADYFTWLRISIEKPLLVLPSLTVGYRQHRSSYSNTMREQQRSKFFESYLAAAQEVLSERNRCVGADEPLFSGKLELSRLMFAWLDARRREQCPGAGSIVRALENELRRHPCDFVTELWRNVFYFAAPAPERFQILRRGWSLLQEYARIPLWAHALRASLRAYIAQRVQSAAKKIPLP